MPGDVIVLHSDGITDQPNPKGVEYGTARLARKLQKLCGKPPEDIATQILADLDHYKSDAPTTTTRRSSCSKSADRAAMVNIAIKRCTSKKSPLADIARREGTPSYVYSRAAFSIDSRPTIKPSAMFRTKFATPSKPTAILRF
jgi:hypothetical protein